MFSLLLAALAPPPPASAPPIAIFITFTMDIPPVDPVPLCCPTPPSIIICVIGSPISDSGFGCSNFSICATFLGDNWHNKSMAKSSESHPKMRRKASRPLSVSLCQGRGLLNSSLSEP